MILRSKITKEIILEDLASIGITKDSEYSKVLELSSSMLIDFFYKNDYIIRYIDTFNVCKPALDFNKNALRDYVDIDKLIKDIKEQHEKQRKRRTEIKSLVKENEQWGNKDMISNPLTEEERAFKKLQNELIDLLFYYPDNTIYLVKYFDNSKSNTEFYQNGKSTSTEDYHHLPKVACLSDYSQASSGSYIKGNVAISNGEFKTTYAIDVKYLDNGLISFKDVNGTTKYVNANLSEITPITQEFLEEYDLSY